MSAMSRAEGGLHFGVQLLPSTRQIQAWLRGASYKATNGPLARGQPQRHADCRQQIGAENPVQPFARLNGHGREQWNGLQRCPMCLVAFCRIVNRKFCLWARSRNIV